MTNRLAKILLICAIVVCVPLFIAGTTLAVYYSKNASLNIAVYIDNVGEQYGDTETPTITSSAKSVVYNEEDGTYTLTNCHVQNISVSFNSTGYEFIGWFEGTYEEYSIALSGEEEISYLTNTAVLNTTTANYENLTAVFNVLTYTVEYSDGNGDAITDLDGSYYYDYNQSLEIVSVESGYVFVGWVIDGDESETIYTRATFPASYSDSNNSDNVKLKAKIEEEKEYTIEFYDANNSIISSERFRPSNAGVVTVPNLDSYEKTGYTVYWVYDNGDEVVIFNEITSEMITQNYSTGIIKIYLKEELIEKTVTVVVPNDATFTGNTTLTVTQENYEDVLGEVLNNNNWIHNTYQYIFGFEGVEFDSVTYTSETINDLWTEILNSEEDITLTGILGCQYTLTVGDLSFSDGFLGSIYAAEDEDTEIIPNGYSYSVDVTGDILSLFFNSETGITEATFYACDSDGFYEVEPLRISCTYNSQEIDKTISNFETIYDFMEYLIKEYGVPSSDEIEITNTTLVFAEIED